VSVQDKYVAAALVVMRLAKTDHDLVEWWKGEKQNRETLRLSPDTSPGLELYNELKSYRNTLKEPT
jgi:hypothetical protein